MHGVTVLALGLIVAGCGRRNFNDDAGVDSTVVDARECTAPATGCVNGEAYTCGGVCYLFCTNTASRPAAAAVCEEWGGCLARIDSLAANNCAASRGTDNAWIGALQDNNAASPAAGWRWCDGELISFNRWGANSPDDVNGTESGEEQCVWLKLTGDWIDSPCFAQVRFTCSRPL